MVVIVLPTLKSGGTEWQTVQLIQHLHRSRRIYLWVFDARTADSNIVRAVEAISNVTIIYGKSLKTIIALARQRPRTILSYAINFYVPEVLLKLLSGAPLITERRNQYHWLKHQRRRRLQEGLRNRLTSRVICNSQAVADQMLHIERIPKRQVTIIYNGVAEAVPHMTPGKSIIVISNIKKGKGIERALELFELLNPFTQSYGISFAIYGRLDDPAVFAGPFADVANRVYKGSVPSRIALEDALCLVHLSESEGFPNAVLEAVAAGVIPVLSDIPVHRELFANCAFLVPDTTAATEAVREIIRLSREDQVRWRAMADRCLAISHRHSAAVRAENYETLFDAYSS